MIRSDNLIHEIFAGYRITARHSSSAFSTTFIGESISPSAACQHVLIKMLSTNGIHTDQDIIHKISSLQQLHHPHILPILTSGTRNDTPYIITEYLKSESLYDRLQHQTEGEPLETEEALHILSQVGQALQYAHEQQVIHGHLKPQNVLLTMQDEALVTGFHRRALQLPDEAEDTSSLELSIYRAPEQLLGQVNEKSDQYALGCIAYTMFTGHQAFIIPSVNMPGTYYKTKTPIAPRRLNAALPSYIEEAILKAMSREPDQRYRDITAFLAALKISSATRTRDLTKTTTLQKLTLEDVSSVTLTSIPETPDKPLPLVDIIIKDEKHAHLGVLSRLLPNIVEQAKPAMSSQSLLLDVSSGYLSAEDEITFKIHMPHDLAVKPTLPKSKKRSVSHSQHTLAIIICLIAATLLFATTLLALSFSTPQKKSGTPSFTHSPLTTPSSIPTQAPSPAATRTGSISPTTIPSQSQGTTINPMPTLVPTVGSSGFLQGVNSISTSQAQFWFAPNGWVAGSMLLHYTSTGQVQQNVQMSYNSNAATWEYTVSGLGPGQTVIYSFSYQQGQTQYTSGTYTYIVGASAPSPVVKPTPTSARCPSNYSQGTTSINASQGQFWFSSCGWTAGYVILHYTGTGQAQQNIQMFYNSSVGLWQYTVSGLNSTQTITYWFTYQQNGTQYDSATYTWVHPGK